MLLCVCVCVFVLSSVGRVLSAVWLLIQEVLPNFFRKFRNTEDGRPWAVLACMCHWRWTLNEYGQFQISHLLTSLYYETLLRIIFWAVYVYRHCISLKLYHFKETFWVGSMEYLYSTKLVKYVGCFITDICVVVKTCSAKGVLCGWIHYRDSKSADLSRDLMSFNNCVTVNAPNLSRMLGLHILSEQIHSG